MAGRVSPMRIAAAFHGIAATYKYADCCAHDAVHAIDLSGWEKVITRLAQDLHDGKLKPEDLDEEMIRESYSELNKKARAGYGDDWLKVNNDTGTPDPVILKMQQNLFRFSGAKTLAELEELNSRLYKNGKRLGWDEFKQEALKINEQYNLNHAQAEWQTATQAGLHAQNWGEYQRNKKQFPNLKYKTQGDDRVRDEHRQLEGVIAPIDSPFWQKYYPPNGWRCRCYTVQTAEAPTRDIPDEVPGVKTEFRINVATGGQVFNEQDTKDAKAHSYFALAKAVGGRQLKVSFERSKLSAPYNKAVHKSPKGKGSVDISPFADLSGFDANYKSAVVIADSLGYTVKLRPHIETSIFPTKNPEYLINDKIGELKTPSSYTAVRARMADAIGQGASVIVCNLDEFTNWVSNELYNSVRGKLLSYKSTKQGSMIFIQSGKAVEIDMADFYSNKMADVTERLEKIKADN